jgi:hypothetical protein
LLARWVELDQLFPNRNMIELCNSTRVGIYSTLVLYLYYFLNYGEEYFLGA